MLIYIFYVSFWHVDVHPVLSASIHFAGATPYISTEFFAQVCLCCYYIAPLIHIESALEELSAIFMRCAYLADETLFADKVEMINVGGALPSQKLPFVRQRVLEVLILLLCVCEFVCLLVPRIFINFGSRVYLNLFRLFTPLTG